MKKFYYPICVLLSLAITSVFVLSSCGVIIINDDTETTAPETTAETTAAETISNSPTLDYLERSKEYLTALPQDSFSGADKLIIGVGASTLEGSETGTVLDLYRFKRNKSVQSTYNTTLVYRNNDDSTTYSELKAAIESGEQYADLLLIPQNSLGKYVIDGLLYDVTALPNTDYEEPYFNYSAMAKTGGSALYGILGDAVEDPDYTYAMYFNKTLIAKAGLTSPYDLVSTGEWTWDKFNEYMGAVAASEHGIGELALHGSAVREDAYSDVLFFSSGESLITSLFGNTPTLTAPSSLGESIMSRINAIFTDGSLYDGDAADTKFINGEMVFYVDTLAFTSSLVTVPTDWGVLPLPKATAEQANYSCLAAEDAPVIAVPANCANTEETSLLIRALFASSYKFIKSAYAENQMSYYLRDSDSVDMVYLIVNSAAYDASYMYGESLPTLKKATITALRSAADSGVPLAETYDKYAEDVNAELAETFGATPAE